MDVFAFATIVVEEISLIWGVSSKTVAWNVS